MLDCDTARRDDPRACSGGADDMDITLAKKDKDDAVTTEVTHTDKKLTAPVEKGDSIGTPWPIQ